MEIPDGLVNDLLKGAANLHRHGDSEPIPRMQDGFDIAMGYTKAGMRTMVPQARHTLSSCRRALVQRYVEEWVEREGLKSIRFFGGVSLNRPIGGVNPDAVRTSAFFPKGKFLWMATTDSYHQDYWREAGTSPAHNGPNILTEDGELVTQQKGWGFSPRSQGLVPCGYKTVHEEEA